MNSAISRALGASTRADKIRIFTRDTILSALRDARAARATTVYPSRPSGTCSYARHRARPGQTPFPSRIPGKRERCSWLRTTEILISQWPACDGSPSGIRGVNASRLLLLRLLFGFVLCSVLATREIVSFPGRRGGTEKKMCTRESHCVIQH